MKKFTNDEIEKIYLDLISPINFRGNFKNDIEFKNYLNNRNLDDLNILMSKFVEAQDYETCCLIRDSINDYKLKKLMK
jgi:protein-arginine kinase activator protein McsA